MMKPAVNSWLMQGSKAQPTCLNLWPPGRAIPALEFPVDQLRSHLQLRCGSASLSAPSYLPHCLPGVYISWMHSSTYLLQIILYLRGFSRHPIQDNKKKLYWVMRQTLLYIFEYVGYGHLILTRNCEGDTIITIFISQMRKETSSKK